MKTLLRHGRVALDDRLQEVDILLADGRVAAVGAVADSAADEVVDARGCYVLPGFIDFHTHVDDWIGPYYLSDTYASSTRTAVANGVTTLCTFVTQGPDETLRTAMDRARAKATGTSHCDVLWHLTPTTFGPRDLADLGVLLAGGYRTLKLYTTYKAAGIFADYDRIEGLFKAYGPQGTRFMVHCEDDGIIAAVDAAGLDLSKASAHGRLRPQAAEVEAIRRVVDLAVAHRAALHVVHVSTLEGLQILQARRSEGDLSCETCPQYLWLDEGWLAREDGHRWLCSPPLRPDRAPFVELVRAGAADMLATDHCPFCRRDKDAWDGRDYRQVPNGLPGLGALPHLAWKLWADDPDRAALNLAQRLARNPAQRAGVGDRKGSLAPGMDADLVVLDPRGPERPVQSTAADAHEAFAGFTSTLAFRQVFLRGTRVARDGALEPGLAPTGVPLQPAAADLFPA